MHAESDAEEKAYLHRAFMRVAVYFKDIWDENHHDERNPMPHHSRVMEKMLWMAVCRYKNFSLGESVELRKRRAAGEAVSTRIEHLVPMVYMSACAADMFKKGRSEEDVARMLERCYRTAALLAEEVARLDKNPPNGVGLKTTMPDGWDCETGDVKARLEAAGIQLDSASSQIRIWRNIGA